ELQHAPGLTLDAAVHESNPASVCWQVLPEYPAVMRDRRVHACVAQGTPERYLIGGENETTEILLKRLDRAHRPEPVATDDDCLGARRHLLSHPLIEPPRMLVVLAARQTNSPGRVDDFDLLAAEIFAAHLG